MRDRGQCRCHTSHYCCTATETPGAKRGKHNGLHNCADQPTDPVMSAHRHVWLHMLTPMGDPEDEAREADAQPRLAGKRVGEYARRNQAMPAREHWAPRSASSWTHPGRSLAPCTAWPRGSPKASSRSSTGSLYKNVPGRGTPRLQALALRLGHATPGGPGRGPRQGGVGWVGVESTFPITTSHPWPPRARPRHRWPCGADRRGNGRWPLVVLRRPPGALLAVFRPPKITRPTVCGNDAVRGRPAPAAGPATPERSCDVPRRHPCRCSPGAPRRRPRNSRWWSCDVPREVLRSPPVAM